MNKEDSSGEGKSQDASTPDNPADLPAKDLNAEIYENRGPKKIIRVVTVMAYLFSVSFVGILLSAYYIFLWEPPNPTLIQREHLRTDPQMQFMIAPPSEETDLTKKDSFLQQSKVHSMHESLLSRMAHDTYDGDSVVDPRDKINVEKKQRLNTMLLNLRYSLVDTLRAQKRNSSQQATNSSGFNNSFVEQVLNSTVDRAENTISRYGESHGNISEEKTSSDNADLPVEFTEALDVESTSSISKFMTIPGTETSQRHFDRDSVTNINPIIEEEKRYHRENDAVKSYLVRGFSNATTNSDVTNSSDRRVFKDNDFSKATQEFLKIDKKEPMKQNETADRRLIDNGENDSDDIQTGVISKERVNGNIKRSQENYFNESSSNDQIGQIARDRVSIDPSSRDSGFINDSGFHQTPDPTVIKSRPRITGTRNSEGERIRANLPALRRWDKQGRAKRDCVIIQ